jgi:hypothetical protein
MHSHCACGSATGLENPFGGDRNADDTTELSTAVYSASTAYQRFHMLPLVLPSIRTSTLCSALTSSVIN